MKTKTNQKNGQFADHEPQRLKKACFGCGDAFTDHGNDFDYCRNCAANNNRYIPGRFKPNQCSECGDGSGWIQFPNQPIRACKLCSLQPRVIQKEVKRA
ncbi:MAG: hypothetical protein MRECE_42c019 [Mycoplasmataceae bacterium CE_OT135]|nr:MAG: hypothetical protein MRECE_42c019 [Mycoplasmataceae bacterium CE_OT135]